MKPLDVSCLGNLFTIVPFYVPPKPAPELLSVVQPLFKWFWFDRIIKKLGDLIEHTFPNKS